MRKPAAVDKGSSAKDYVLLLKGLYLCMVFSSSLCYLNPNSLGRSYYWPAKLGGS